MGETLRQALETLSAEAPNWLRQQVDPDWVKRYGQPLDDGWLPKKAVEKQALAEQIGRDGSQLLTAIWNKPELVVLRHLAAVDILRQDGRIRWRAQADTPPATLRILSPYDLDARGAKKRHKLWFGYRVHLTESCDEDQPRLITDVQTVLAPGQDYNATPVIQQALAERQLLPAKQVADAAYVSGHLIVTAREEFDLDLVGPVMPDTSWQAAAGQGFDLSNFQIDWASQQVTCPLGKTSIYWHPTLDRSQKPIITVPFSGKDCQSCQHRLQCTQSGRVSKRRCRKVRWRWGCAAVAFGGWPKPGCNAWSPLRRSMSNRPSIGFRMCRSPRLASLILRP